MSGCWGGTGELAQAGEVMTTQFKHVEMHTQVHSCSPFGGKQPGLHFWLQRISDHVYLTCRMGLMTRKVAWMACGSTVTAGLWISQSMTYRMCRATTHIVSALGYSPPALVLPLRSSGCMVQQRPSKSPPTPARADGHMKALVCVCISTHRTCQDLPPRTPPVAPLCRKGADISHGASALILCRAVFGLLFCFVRFRRSA